MGALVVGFAALAIGCRAPAGSGAPVAEESEGARVERGEYLVAYGGCGDCHTPKRMGERGPEPDPGRLLAGHPEGEAVVAVPEGALAPGGWEAMSNGDSTAWAGPWGVSFATNLTSDEATGLGSWSEAMFVQSMRTGRHQGAGREILPPMPWQSVAALTDEDLSAVWAYLRTVPPVVNSVPQPMPPAGSGR
jgi:mono/diheme cytochrome c family protein